MNPDDLHVGSIAMTDTGDYGVVTNGGIVPMTMTASNVGSSVTIRESSEYFMDKWSLNRFAVDHKVQEQELLKLKEVAPDYASEIKENLAKNLARDITKKVTFTKKHDKDADVHHFIGRCWIFTDEELKNLIKDVQGA